MFVSAEAIACIVVLVFFVVSLVLLEKRDQRRKEQEAARDCQYDTKHQGIPQRASHPTDEEHRTAEQAHWHWQVQSDQSKDWISRATFYFLIIATCVATLAFWQTWRQADIANATYIATARAWVDVSVDPGSASLTWLGGNDGYTVMNLTLINHGSSPAITTQAFIKVIPTKHPVNEVRSLKESCTDRNSGGSVAFPSVPIKILSQLSFGIPEDFIQRLPQRGDTKPMAFTSLDVAVCVSYKILGDNLIHYTAYLFQFMKPLESGYGTPGLKIGDVYSGTTNIIINANSQSDSAD